jgi:pimeloyl-ACP methyl ester carboxylesterase
VSAWRVVLLPGIVLPAAAAYDRLLGALGEGVDAVAKDLEVYADPVAPASYSLDREVAGLLRTAQARGWDRFHLVGYSAGGAAALAFTALHPGRLLSLALLEPAWAGRWDDTSQAHRELWDRYDQLGQLPPEQFMPAFQRLNVAPGVELPPAPPGDPPPWMALRPAGITAVLGTFRTYNLDREALRRFDRPVLFVLGGLSNPDQFGEEAQRLGRVFPDYSVEVFDDRHHFDPPHRIEPRALARSLRTLWRRAESLTESA